ncbi:MAG: hypothetical protein C0606_11785 [Hyphomicrobiales bacterium]|nr:MAG: hypothetical protein C0606_11785 [Hyphomicrobiales bacterium]
MGIIWENSFWVFLLFTCAIVGGAAWMTGRAVAVTWRPFFQIFWFSALLACADRFLSFALFEGTLLSVHYWLVDFIVLLAITLISWRVARTTQMVTQYSWMYEKSSPFTWRNKPGVTG